MNSKGVCITDTEIVDELKAKEKAKEEEKMEKKRKKSEKEERRKVKSLETEIRKAEVEEKRKVKDTQRKKRGEEMVKTTNRRGKRETEAQDLESDLEHLAIDGDNSSDDEDTAVSLVWPPVSGCWWAVDWLRWL